MSVHCLLHEHAKAQDSVCLFRPFDITAVNERQNTTEQVRQVNGTILRLFEYWKEYYGGLYDTASHPPKGLELTMVEEAELPQTHFLVQERRCVANLS